MEQKQVKCPKCKTQQPLGEACVSCGLNFKEYARQLREKRAAREGAEGKQVKCPKCKTQQPMGEACVSCGLDFKEYARQLREKREAEAAGARKEEEPPKAEESPEAEEPPKAKREKSWEKKEPVDIRIPVIQRAPTLASIEELLGSTWIIYKDRVLLLVALYLLSVVAAIVPIVVFAFIGGIFALAVPGAGTFAAFGASALGALLAIVAWLWVFGGFISAACDETQKFKEALGSGWRNVWSLLWLYLMASYIIGGGFLLLVLPGIAMLVWFFAAQFIIFEENEKGLDAMLKSKAYVSDYGWSVFGRLVLITVLGMIASLVPLVGGILFTPFMMIYMVHMYKDLRAVKGKDVKYSTSSGTKATWITIATLGYVVPIVIGLLVFGMAMISSLRGVDVSSLQQLQQLQQLVGASATTTKQVYAANEPVEINFSGLPGNSKDWINVARTTEPDSTYGEWFYTEGATEGAHIFSGFAPGTYEVRVYFNWPDGGYLVHARHQFTVKGAVGPGADIKPELKLDRISFIVQTEVVVHFSAPSTFARNAWVGIVPSGVPHGSEAENDRRDIANQYLDGRTSGDLVFTAPTRPGIYDMRMFDTDDNGSEAASITFAVEDRP